MIDIRTTARSAAREADIRWYRAHDDAGDLPPDLPAHPDYVADAVAVATGQVWANALREAGFNIEEASPLQHHGPCQFWRSPGPPHTKCDCPIGKLNDLLSALAEASK